MKLVETVQAWRRNSDGVAAIEFAFIAPVMITMFFGVFEMGRAYSMHRRFINTTYMIGDLITRERTMSAADLQGIYDLIKPVMAGYPVDSNLTIQIVPLYVPKTQPNIVRVYATPAGRGSSAPACTTYSVTDDEKKLVQSSAAGLILVKSTYDFKPLFVYPLIGSMKWEYESMFAPRQDCVAFGTNSCLNPC